MLELLLTVVIVGSAVGVLVITREAFRSSLVIGGCLLASGTVVQFAATLGVVWSRSSLAPWAAVTMLLALPIAAILRKGDPESRRRPWRPLAVVLTMSALGGGLLTAVRWVAPSDLLQSVGYLITQPGAEDNAKWLGASADLAQNAPIESFASVGGPLLLLMTIAAILTSTLSLLLLGGVNEVAVSANTILVSQALLISLTPFAVAALFEKRLTRWTPDGTMIKARLPYPLAVLSALVGMTATLLVTQFGHLTLQFVLLVLMTWVSCFAWSVRRDAALVVTTLIVAMTAQVWFPLSTLAVVLLVLVAAWALVSLRRPATRRSAIGALVSVVVISVMMQEFLRSSIAYSLGDTSTKSALGYVGGSVRGVVALAISAAEGPLSIFSSPGGTETLTAILTLLLAVALLAAIPTVIRPARRLGSFTPVIPVGILLAFGIAVTLLDFYATGKGPNYASTKTMFAVGLPILVVWLPIAILRLDPLERRLTTSRWITIGAVVVLLVMDTFVPRAVARLKPALFPAAAGDPPPFWALAEVKNTGQQPLLSNPMGCVFLPPGAEQPSALPDGQMSYSCSRILAGLGGVGTSGAPFVAWQLDEWLQNTSYWDYYAPALNAMPPEARARTVILLGDNKEVVGLSTLDALLQKYPPKPATTS